MAYESYGTSCPLTEAGGPCYAGTVGLLLAVGFLVNGPYALITTAVSADLVRRKIHLNLWNTTIMDHINFWFIVTCLVQGVPS